MRGPNSRLRFLREQVPLTQAELAERVGVAELTVRRWETEGLRRNPRTSEACAVPSTSRQPSSATVRTIPPLPNQRWTLPWTNHHAPSSFTRELSSMRSAPPHPPGCRHGFPRPSIQQGSERGRPIPSSSPAVRWEPVALWGRAWARLLTLGLGGAHPLLGSTYGESRGMCSWV